MPSAREPSSIASFRNPGGRTRCTGSIRPIFAGPLALAILLTTLVIPSAVSAAQPSILASTFPTAAACFSGTSSGQATLDIVWRDSAGATKAAGTIESSGFWIFCSGEDETFIRIGDKIRVVDGSYTRTYVVPDLTIISDRVSDTFHGTGPAGTIDSGSHILTGSWMTPTRLIACASDRTVFGNTTPISTSWAGNTQR